MFLDGGPRRAPRASKTEARNLSRISGAALGAVRQLGSALRARYDDGDIFGLRSHLQGLRTSGLRLGAAAAAALVSALVAAVPRAQAVQEPKPEPRGTGVTRYEVAAIGDSLTDQRIGGGQYLRQLARWCPESRFDAYGVGGQRTDHMRWRFTVDLLQRRRPPKARPRYDHVIVLGGVNDLAAGSVTAPRVQRIERNLGWMYGKAHELGMEVIAVTVPPWGKLAGSYDRRGDATRRLNRWILEQPATHRVEHAVDIHPLLECGEDDELCPMYRRFPNDKVHWGPEGHRIVADALFRAAFADCR